MATLEDLRRGSRVNGVLPGDDLKWHGSAAVEVTYKDISGRLGDLPPPIGPGKMFFIHAAQD